MAFTIETDDMTDVIETQEEQNLARMEAVSLANALYRRHYQDKPDAVGFELCDTTAGILTQIDNMTAGISDELEKLRADNIRLHNEVAMMASQMVTVADELLALINRVNADMKANITSQDLDPPAYLDAQTVQETYELLNKIIVPKGEG